MDKNKIRILKEIKKHKGEICLYCLNMIKLLGFAEDDDDYYYRVQTLTKGEQWYSCVGGLIYLKQLPKKDYKEIKRIFELNCNFLGAKSV
jgi:hypothetical protein